MYALVKQSKVSTRGSLYGLATKIRPPHFVGLVFKIGLENRAFLLKRHRDLGSIPVVIKFIAKIF